MIPKIKSIQALDDFILNVSFDDGKSCKYDVKDDINTIPVFKGLETQSGLFKNVQLDKSRTVVFWNDEIDLASDMIYEFGENDGTFEC